MISNYFFILGTFLISLNSVRVFKLGISDLTFLVATILAIFETLVIDKKNRFCWLKNRLLLPAWIITFGALLAMFRSQNIGVATFELIQSLYVITLYVSLSWIMVRRNLLNTAINALITSALVAVGIALFDYLTHSHIGATISGTSNAIRTVRFAGPFTHPNTLGSMLVVVSGLVLVKWLKAIGRLELVFKQAFYSISMLLFFFGIYLSGSNAALLGEIIVFGVILLFSSRITRMKMIIFIIPVFAFSLLFLFASGSYYGFFDSIARNINRAFTTTIGTRVEVYRYALMDIFHNPFIGIGYDQLPTSGISDQDRLLPGQIHNVLLSILYTGGVVSLIGWGAIYLYTITIAGKVCLIQRKQSFLLHLGLAAGVITTFLIMQFQASLYRRDWWLVIGLLLAVFWETRREKILCKL